MIRQSWLIVALSLFNAASLIAQAQPPVKLSLGFDNLQLGMSYAAIKTALTDKPGFQYRGEPDLSLSPGGEEKIIQTNGGFYIERAIFQFSNDQLFSIILDINPKAVDHFTLFSQFSAKYGDPQSLSPQQAVWDDGTVRILLEQPATVKYLLIQTINDKLRAAGNAKAAQEEARETFLKKL